MSIEEEENGPDLPARARVQAERLLETLRHATADVKAGTAQWVDAAAQGERTLMRARAATQRVLEALADLQKNKRETQEKGGSPPGSVVSERGPEV